MTERAQSSLEAQIGSLTSWAREQGGPSVALLLREGDETFGDEAKSIDFLLAQPTVRSALDCLDGFSTPARDKLTLEHLVHYYKDTCIDNFFCRILGFGLRSGIPEFDEKFRPVEEMFSDLLTRGEAYCHYFSWMLHRFFFMAGSLKAADSMRWRIDRLHPAARERIFDIYQDGKDLPLPPANWRNRGILHDALNPFSPAAQTPLPSIYDLSAMSYFYPLCPDPGQRKKMDEIVNFLLAPEFQRIPPHYGLLWEASSRRYHACGWCPSLPGPEAAHAYLHYALLLSAFPSGRACAWYHQAMEHLETFRTPQGTFLFPRRYLDGRGVSPGTITDAALCTLRPENAFVNAENLQLPRGKREERIREILSTVNMIRLFKREIASSERSFRPCTKP